MISYVKQSLPNSPSAKRPLGKLCNEMRCIGIENSLSLKGYVITAIQALAL